MRVDVVRRETTLYRGCHGAALPELVRGMRSNYEAGRRPHPAERNAIVTFMAVSMFEDGERLRRFALQRPDRIGTHIAIVELRPGLGICLADTGGEGHWSVWGLPDQLAQCVVDVVPIDLGPV
jgi:hypothetical protein